MLIDWLSSLSIVATGAVTFFVMLMGAGAGQLIRRIQAKRAQSEERESEPSVAQEGYLLSSSLGLLGLLLAFSFGMVLNRYEARRELVTTEANAIAIIADINRPMSGTARESQQAMRMLLASLKAQPPEVFDKFATRPANAR